MSQEYYILNLLDIKDKNIKLIDNFYKIEGFREVKYNFTLFILHFMCKVFIFFTLSSFSIIFL